MRRLLSVFALALFLVGCGSSSRSFGQAAEEWCGDHYGRNDKTEMVCFETVTERGPRFLEKIETGEIIENEVARIAAGR